VFTGWTGGIDCWHEVMKVMSGPIVPWGFTEGQHGHLASVYRVNGRNRLLTRGHEGYVWADCAWKGSMATSLVFTGWAGGIDCWHEVMEVMSGPIVPWGLTEGQHGHLASVYRVSGRNRLLTRGHGGYVWADCAWRVYGGAAWPPRLCLPGERAE
jgi:hypothetical protein